MAKRKVMAFQESVGILSAAAQIKPEALAEVDVNQMLRDALHGAGAPAQWFKSEEAKQAEMAAAAQMANLQKMAGMVQTGADVAKSVSQASIAAQMAEQGPTPQAAGVMGG
jgi:hypothetical protein